MASCSIICWSWPNAPRTIFRRRRIWTRQTRLQEQTERNTRGVSKSAEALPDGSAIVADLNRAADRMGRAISALREDAGTDQQHLAAAYDPPQVEALAALEQAKDLIDQQAAKANQALDQQTEGRDSRSLPEDSGGAEEDRCRYGWRWTRPRGRPMGSLGIAMPSCSMSFPRGKDCWRTRPPSSRTIWSASTAWFTSGPITTSSSR